MINITQPYPLIDSDRRSCPYWWELIGKLKGQLSCSEKDHRPNNSGWAFHPFQRLKRQIENPGESYHGPGIRDRQEFESSDHEYSGWWSSTLSLVTCFSFFAVVAIAEQGTIKLRVKGDNHIFLTTFKLFKRWLNSCSILDNKAYLLTNHTPKIPWQKLEWLTQKERHRTPS